MVKWNDVGPSTSTYAPSHPRQRFRPRCLTTTGLQELQLRLGYISNPESLGTFSVGWSDLSLYGHFPGICLVRAALAMDISPVGEVVQLGQRTSRYGTTYALHA